MLKRNKAAYYLQDPILRKYGLAVDAIGLWKAEIHFITKYFKLNDYILDLGCGSGRTTINMFIMGYQNIIGVDLSKAMIEQAQNIAFEKNLELEFLVGDATNLINFQDNQFAHCLFSFNGFTAIPSSDLRLQALKEIKRVIKPGGYYIFSAHNREQITFAHHWTQEQKRWENGTQNPEFEMFGDHYIDHGNGLVDFIHMHAIDEMVLELKSVGFEIVEVIDRNKEFNENKAVHDFSGNTIFYIVRKPTN